MLRQPVVLAACLIASCQPAASQSPIGAPALQFRFISTIEAARSEYTSGQNDLAKGAARPNRAKGLCVLLKGQRIQSWTGYIDRLTTNNEGRGVISIDIGSGIMIKTWNNAISDAVDRTLLDPDGRVFNMAKALKKGDAVAFSGSFIADQKDCIRETSMTMGGSIRNPEFVFRFTDLAKR